MSKNKRSSNLPKSPKATNVQKFSLSDKLPEKFHIPIAIAVIVLLFIIFLNPLYFGGKTFESGDIIASESMIPAVNQDGFTLWNPYIFCGMPAYALSTDFPWFNLITVGITGLRSAFSAFFEIRYAMWSFYLVVLAFTSFLLMRHLTKNTLVSLFTALATSFGTGLIVFLFIGHVTKLTSLCMFPAIILVLLRLQKKNTLLDFLILIIVLQLSLQGFHAQIIFYMLFAVGIYFVFYFLYSLAKKQLELRNNILKSAGLFVAAIIIALIIHSDNISQIYEYTPYSTRGTESLSEKTSGGAEQSYYEYHTDWSFSPEEVMTFIVPSFYGFGGSKYSGPLTQGREVEVNTYFGQMPFVDVAMYMGVVIFFLGLFAIYTLWKEPFIKFLTIVSGLALLLSFGKNFPVLFDLMFYNLPYFDKFRVPSMALVLVQLIFPILAGLGLKKIIDLKNEPDSKVLNVVKFSAIGFSAFFVLAVILNGAITSWFTERVNTYAASVQTANPNLARQFQALAEYSSSMFSTDLMLAFLFLSVSFWAAHLYLKGKLAADVLSIILIVVILVDLWRIDFRGEKYRDEQDKQNMFNEPEYISVIKSRNDKVPFRMLNLKQDGSLGSVSRHSNFNAYFLVEDFYGYSGIKPRAYQDILDVVGFANPTLWRMLNVKYIVTDQEVQFPGFSLVKKTGSGVVYEYTNALPRLYLVDSVAQKSSMDFLNLVKENSFDPKNVVFIEEKAPGIQKPDSTASVKIVKYSDDQVEAQVNASGNNFLFLGNTYVPTGWKVSIDGNEVDLYKVNHGFMGVIVPSGNHRVTFNYKPVSFVVSKYLSLAFSSLSIAGVGIILLMRKRKKIAGQE